MKSVKKILTGVLLLVMAATLFSFDLPTSWFKAGSAPKSYDMGIDKGAGKDGKNAATIKCIDQATNGFGTMMQNCLPDNYLCKLVRMSGMVKTKDVADWAGLWFRVDQKGNDGSLSFDNMHDGKKDRSIKGTTDWTRYEIVLDVASKATNIAYGALLVGTGQIWFDNLKFEVVDNSVALTGEPKDKPLTNAEPANLDFEK